MKLLSRAMQGVISFAKLERILAAVCITTPLFLILGDTEPIRNSISAYYEMDNNVLYYVPLSVAFMLFVVNGVIKKQRAYNTILGAMLAGLVLFNLDDFKWPHRFFAGSFFIGNALVIVAFSPREELWFKSLLVFIILAALGAWWFFMFSLFWAEWISLFIIGAHYILESLKDQGTSPT